jgi:hypothetical protein
MSQSARVTSIEAVKEFQAALASFCAEARDALGAVAMEARRVHESILHDQLHGWRRAVRDRQEDLSQAKADLFRRQLARISGQDPDVIEQKEAVWLAQRRLEEAEDKVEKCRQWARLLQEALDEYQAPAQQLAALVEGKPPRSVAYLDQILDALDTYVAAAPPAAPRPPG